MSAGAKMQDGNNQAPQSDNVQGKPGRAPSFDGLDGIAGCVGSGRTSRRCSFAVLTSVRLGLVLSLSLFTLFYFALLPSHAVISRFLRLIYTLQGHLLWPCVVGGRWFPRDGAEFRRGLCR